MSQHESDDVWAAEQEAVEAPALDPSAEVSCAVADPGDDDSQPEVLARLPDLEAVESGQDAEAKPARSDGRLLSQGLSTKLLLGGGALLVIAAIFPFVLGGSSEPKPGTPPAPDADPAPIWNGRTAQTQGSQPGSPSISYEPNMSFNPSVPAAPDFIREAQAPDAEPSPQTTPLAEQGQSDPTGDQGQPVLPDPRLQQGALNLQAQPPRLADQTSPRDTRGQAPPAARRPQTRAQGPQTRANQMMRINDPRPTAGDRPGDHRPGSQAGFRTDPQARQSAWSVPVYRPGEPGVARLEGIIEKAFGERPTLRTTYDSTRSSIH